MSANKINKPKPDLGVKVELDVCVGKAELAAGRLIFRKHGARQFSQFAYREAWLRDAQFFNISPDLVADVAYQTRKPPSKDDSLFFLALADTEPDAWGDTSSRRAPRLGAPGSAPPARRPRLGLDGASQTESTRSCYSCCAASSIILPRPERFLIKSAKLANLF